MDLDDPGVTATLIDGTVVLSNAELQAEIAGARSPGDGGSDPEGDEGFVEDAGEFGEEGEDTGRFADGSIPGFRIAECPVPSGGAPGSNRTVWGVAAGRLQKKETTARSSRQRSRPSASAGETSSQSGVSTTRSAEGSARTAGKKKSDRPGGKGRGGPSQ